LYLFFLPHPNFAAASDAKQTVKVQQLVFVFETVDTLSDAFSASNPLFMGLMAQLTGLPGWLPLPIPVSARTVLMLR
jgi:hypothetical protein